VAGEHLEWKELKPASQHSMYHIGSLRPPRQWSLTAERAGDTPGSTSITHACLLLTSNHKLYPWLHARCGCDLYDADAPTG